MSQGVDTTYALRPVTQDETSTCKSMLATDPSSTYLTLMPTHHVTEFGDMCGFRFECAAGASGACIPVSRRAFFGHTASYVLEPDHATILRLMSDPASNAARMRNFLAAVEAGATAPAVLECVPHNTDAHTARGTIVGAGLRSVDSRAWTPELPESIGIYHAYVRGCSQDVRAHRLFLVCSGGLPKASDAFCNLLIDVGGKWTAGEVAVSQEAWWLRKACYRARCQLLKRLADEFGLRVQHVQDIQSRDPALMAIHCVDTVEHDIFVSRDTAAHGADRRARVTTLSGCCDTTHPFNGMLCRMHPAEGYWLFRGAPRADVGFGSMFGSGRVGAFPTSQPQVHMAKGASVRVPPWAIAAPAGGDNVLVRLHSTAPTPPARYQSFDEAYFKNLEAMQWNRDYGFVELMPIVVGMP